MQALRIIKLPAGYLMQPARRQFTTFLRSTNPIYGRNIFALGEVYRPPVAHFATSTTPPPPEVPFEDEDGAPVIEVEDLKDAAPSKVADKFTHNPVSDSITKKANDIADVFETLTKKSVPAANKDKTKP